MKTVYESKVFSVVEDGSHSIVRHRGAYGIVAQPDPRSVLLIRQYRPAAQRELLEIPAGTADGDEPPVEGARRELAEETGYRAGSMREIFCGFMTPGFCTETMRFFHATDLQPGATAFDDDERIETLEVSLERALALFEGGEIADVKTAAALLWLDRFCRQHFR